ncbi:hypothetical protein [Pimelobacter simplex]|uniref:oxidoreductase n=1 Tax=Nocardioides simplex TaxID=2045 RepID=UPI00345CE928
MLEWFLSPLTNDRDDDYGGPLENRARFAVEALRAVRDAVGTDLTVGVRFNPARGDARGVRRAGRPRGRPAARGDRPGRLPARRRRLAVG